MVRVKDHGHERPEDNYICPVHCPPKTTRILKPESTHSRTLPTMPDLVLREATETDVPLVLQFIRDLAEYEKLTHTVVATEDMVRNTLFGPRSYAEVIIAEWQGAPAGFALFFHNYSTFLAKPGLYLEDLFVNPELRGKGIGKALLRKLAQIAVERDCGRMEWAVLDWNEPSIQFYKSLGAVPMSDWIINRLTGDSLNALASQVPAPSK
jgi:GNAT superfamily N-acetyltransferase